MADRMAQQLGNYRVLRPIGHGSFADVYLGEHAYLQTQVALKLLQMHLAEEEMEGFPNEARTIAHLENIYVFTSQRNQQLTEAAIHHWFRSMRRQATKDQSEKIADLSFHDLRHDFAHRAREAGWTLEEVAYYLGHVTQERNVSHSNHGEIYSGKSRTGQRVAQTNQRIA
jgi:integrase